MPGIRAREGVFQKEFGTRYERKAGIARYPVYGTRVDVWKGRALMTRSRLTVDNFKLRERATGRRLNDHVIVSIEKGRQLLSNPAMARNIIPRRRGRQTRNGAFF